MIEQILGEAVAAAEAFHDPADAGLFPEEETLLAHAVDKRRREFRTVRACARQALAELGLPPRPILAGERGAPQWPPGIVGSMTHCEGYRVAAVAWNTQVPAVGIDAEPHDSLPGGVLTAIALPAELRQVEWLAAQLKAVRWDRLLFSAKESVYKAWFPMTRRFLDFDEADIQLRTDGTFTARLLAASTASGNATQFARFEGRWLVANGLIVTAISQTCSALTDPRS